MRHYLYHLIAKYIQLHVRPEDPMILVASTSESLPEHFRRCPTWASDIPEDNSSADYIVISGRIHYERDIQTFL